MEVLVAAPFRAGSIAWQEQPEQWTLTVVCKATYALAPGTSPLAAEAEDVNERDNHWDDDPRRSVYAPGDLAPKKPSPEVMLVGSAFAPGGEAVRALFVRIIVGELDKSLEVLGPRAWGQDGTLREGPRWTKMPLRYERAAGGPGTWNPVGLSPDVTDTYGRRALPNLQSPGVDGSAPGVLLLPVGLGPIAAAWPSRREKLLGRAAGWSDEGWNEAPLGGEVDATFFQAAPPDQRVEMLRADEPIILENLLPLHPRLVTRLAGARPRARVEALGQPAWDLSLVADTLWIDTDRAIATLTWRGQVPLDDRYQPGRVVVGVEEQGRPVRWPEPRRPSLPSSAGGAPAAGRPAARAPAGDAREDELVHTAVDDAAIAEPRHDRTLPFVKSATARPVEVPPLPRVPPPAPADHGETVALTGDEANVWIGPARPAPPAIPPPRPSAPSLLNPMPAPSPSAPGLAPPPPIATLLRQSDPGISAPPLSIGERAAAEVAYGGVLAASNAAARPEEGAPSPARNGSAAAKPAAPAPRVIVELLWYDAAKVARVREHEAWAPLLAPPEERPPAAAEGEPADAPEQRARAERADIASVLSRAAPAGDLEAALAGGAGAEGAIEPPLLVASGELELPLDDGKMLEVLLGAATSLASGDKRLEDVVALAGAVTRTPLGASPDVAAGFCAQVREAWAKANRMLPADYLDVHARRILLDQRAYQRRTLWDEEWIRALLWISAPRAAPAAGPRPATTPPPDGAAVPTYLPAALAKRLPLFARFPARVVAEAVPQQDQYESHPVALRVLALGRVLPARHRPRAG